MVNYADYRLVYVAVSAGQKNFGFRKKNLLRDKLTTPIIPCRSAIIFLHFAYSSSPGYR